MAIFSNGWAQHFKSMANLEANKNMKAFTQAFAPTTMLAKRVNALVKEIDTAVLLVGPNDRVLQTHSLTKFGGTRSCPNIIVGSLIGMGPRAIAVIIDHGAAVASTTIIIPTATKIANCKTIKELVALASGSSAMASMMAPQAATQAVRTPPRRRGATTATATTATTPVSTRTTRHGSLAGGAASPTLARPPRSSACRGSEAPPTAAGATNAAATATAVTATTSDATTAATVGTTGAALVKEVDAAMLLVGPGGTVLQTHSWAKFSGTRYCPNFIVGSLIGTGPRASTVVINHGAAIASSTVTIPAATEIASWP
jgi:hypothetical protein